MANSKKQAVGRTPGARKAAAPKPRADEGRCHEGRREEGVAPSPLAHARAPLRSRPLPRRRRRRRRARRPPRRPRARAARRSNRRGAAARRGETPLVEPPHAVPGLSEEDQIRAAKFLPRELPKRLFEEERFLFPESYGQNRIRLLVRDPEWIFAYWDVKPQTLEDLAKRVGERALALSRLTLRVVDPVSGGSSDILLPAGARWWYVRTDSARRTYRAELGITLPSGEFRRLAESNTVVTPRVGPSPERARRRMSYRDASELAPAAAAAAGRRGPRARPRERAVGGGVSRRSDSGATPGAPARARAERGGASDSFRPGGASDAFKR